MTFIDTVPEDQAVGAVAAIYSDAEEMYGYVPNFTQAFSLRPGVYQAWLGLNGAIKSGMDLRRYELATIAAARRLRSSYCMLAHGSVLMEKYLDPEALRAVVADHRAADLSDADIAVMEFAEKIVDDASSVEQTDIDRLHSAGLSDEEILDVALAATARCFFSKTLDALGAQPDAKFAELDPEIRDALTIGRAIATR
jgi:uncharacterized peroxidase-related enzyme